MSEHTNDFTNYEPNFILKPATGDTADAKAESTDRISDPAHSDSAGSTEDVPRGASSVGESGNKPNETPGPKESPAAEVLRAAAARADALKAAAIKADKASEPYRRETSELSEAEMDAFGASSSGASGGSGSFGGSTNSGYGSFGSTAGSGSNSFGSSASSGSGSFGGSAGSGSFGGSASSGSGNFGGSASSGAGPNSFGGYGGSNRFGGSANGTGRPTYENPSFDPGRTGRFTDPRDSFRGESASWSNGEMHRSRKQMKDSINRQAKQKKAPKPVTMSRRALGLLIAGCLCLSCLFGLGGAALGTSLVKQNLTNTAQTATTEAKTGSDSAATSAGYTLEKATGSNMTIKEITAATKSSVVEIRTESVSSDTWMQQYVTQGAGSGVIISKDGYIMTNNHVIEGASKIKVTTADEKEYEAELIGADETNDVAVLKVDASDLTPATYGDSDQLEVGDLAVAIGNPLGELGGTVTAGIVSATDRELAIDGKTLHLLQTDSSINPGNSGGGLFNGDGQLIGLVVAKSSGSDVEGLGFAIPINTAANVAQQLIDKGYVSGQPFTGMTYQTGTSGSGNGSDPFSNFDSFFGDGSSTGVYIYSVNGENAKKAGFQPGDLVYAVDGEQITSFEDLTTIITSHKVGDKVTFTIVRDGVQKKIKLKLEEKTAAAQEQASQSGQDQQNGQTPDGQQDGQQNNQNGQMPNDQNGQNGQPDQSLPGDDSGLGGWQEFFNQFF